MDTRELNLIYGAIAAAPAFVLLVGCAAPGPEDARTPQAEGSAVAEAEVERAEPTGVALIDPEDPMVHVLDLKEYEDDGFGYEVPGSATPIAGSTAESFDWREVDPLEFLDYLASQETSLYTVWGTPHAGWITEEHAAELMTRIRSTEPASGVVSALSSMLPLEQREDGTYGFRVSTVGREAQFLLEGFRSGRYPPTLSSQDYFSDDPDSTERWWASRP